MAPGALPKNETKKKGTESTSTPAAEPSKIKELSTPLEIKKGESKILEPKYDKMQVCAYEKCPITKKQILFGMHCVFFENKTYHAMCAKQVSIDFKIQQPPRRAKEAST